MARNTITRLTSRIDDLTERLPNRRLTTIVGTDQAECWEQLEEMRAAGKPIGRTRFIIIDVGGG